MVFLEKSQKNPMPTQWSGFIDIKSFKHTEAHQHPKIAGI